MICRKSEKSLFRNQAGTEKKTKYVPLALIPLHQLFFVEEADDCI